MENLKVTSISDLQGFAAGEIVELPGFTSDKPFIVRLKRPSMMVLVANGEIPNELLKTANGLFDSGVQSFDADKEAQLSDMYKVLDVIAKASLAEPTMEDIEKTGLQLTDEQLLAIFAYSQRGVKALNSFLTK